MPRLGKSGGGGKGRRSKKIEGTETEDERDGKTKRARDLIDSRDHVMRRRRGF